MIKDDITRVVSKYGMDGYPETVNSVAIRVFIKDNVGDILFCTGITKPTDASDGYAKGCIFIDTDVATGTGGMYLNKGTKDSCVFSLVTQA
jgi:hypothetical protein